MIYSLRHKLWIGFGALLVVIVAVSALSLAVFTRYSHALERVFRENYDSAVYCDEMKDSLEQLNLRAQFLVWKQQAAEPMNAAAEEARFQRALNSQLNNCTLPGEAERTLKLADLWEQYKWEYNQFEKAPANARTDFYCNDLLFRCQQMKANAQQIADMNMNNMISVDGQAKTTLLKVKSALEILVIAGTVLAGIVVSAVGATILQPLNALTRSAREMEAGNLDLHVPVKSRDEVGKLAEAFNAMSAKLREFRKLDHERLLRTQQTTQLAIDSLPDGVFIVGPGGRIEISNRAARHYFEIEPGLGVGELETKLKWLEPLYESVKNGQKPDEPRGYQSAVQLFEDGQERFLLPRAVPMMGTDHQPTGVAFILLDVTRLRAADELKSGVVRMVSHELRTPLTSVRMALDLLSGNKFGPLTPKQNTLLAAARDDGNRLYRIIENLLDMSRIESGGAPLTMTRVPAAEMISQAIASLSTNFAEAKVSLVEPQVSPDLILSADTSCVSHILINLLSNALRFSRPGGEVRIVCEPDDKTVAFSVSDDGPGISAEHLPRLFDKFYRIPSRDYPTGAGLGLAIAREIVIAHFGTITVDSTLGKGSTFRFTLPRA